MTIRTKTPIGTAWVDDHGILWHRLDFGVRVSSDEAHATVKALAEILGDRRAPAIVDIGQLQYADPEARSVFANLSAHAPEIATAILVRPDENLASAIQSFLFSSRPVDRPVAIFEDEDEAVAWARSYLPQV